MEQKNIITSFGIIYRAFVDFTNDILKDSNISFSDSIFLMNIGNQPGISQENISTDLLIDRAAVARSVKSMEEKKLIRVERNSSDKRIKELYLTASGKELYQYISDKNKKRTKQLFRGSTPEEIEGFTKVLNQIRENLQL